MIRNAKLLFDSAPIRFMRPDKCSEHGVSYGLSEAGYDIRIKQAIHFSRDLLGDMLVRVDDQPAQPGRFTLASAIEEFQMPTNLVGIVHDKSTWARRGLSVFNTVIEPGWEGFLTLELVYHGQEPLTIPAGAGIAQVIFHQTAQIARYSGKYQGQPDRPVEAIDTK